MFFSTLDKFKDRLDGRWEGVGGTCQFGVLQRKVIRPFLFLVSYIHAFPSHISSFLHYLPCHIREPMSARETRLFILLASLVGRAARTTKGVGEIKNPYTGPGGWQTCVSATIKKGTSCEIRRRG